jgi:hypothetical protein
MPTKLEQLLAKIDPEVTLDKTSSLADKAMNTFSFSSAQITNRDEFEKCLTDFFCHVDTNVLGVSKSFNSEHRSFQWGRCGILLSHIYGHNAENTAFDMARTGKSGGLYAVLKAIALRMAEEYAENKIAAIIGDYWKKLSLDEQFAAADEYLEKYGHLLPSELTEGGGARIRTNFARVLENHPKILQKTRRLGK